MLTGLVVTVKHGASGSFMLLMLGTHSLIVVSLEPG
jgi:uncharacterized membrane protein